MAAATISSSIGVKTNLNDGPQASISGMKLKSTGAKSAVPSSVKGKQIVGQISGPKSNKNGGQNAAGKAPLIIPKGKSSAASLKLLNAAIQNDVVVGDVAAENQAPKTWKQILSNSTGQPKCTLAFKPLADATYLNNDVIITPSLAFLTESRSKWNTSVVGYFLSSNCAFSFVREQAFAKWGALGLMKVFFDSKGFYTLKFKSEVEKEKFLAAGPYHIGHKAFYVKPWIEGTFFTKEGVATVPLWLTFYNIPTSYWTEDGLSFIASSVGKPVAWDNATALLEPMKFARICVEISVASPLPNNVIIPVLSDVDLSIVRVPVSIEYGSLPASCTTCKVFGHSLAKCPHPKWQPTEETLGSNDANDGVQSTCDTTETVIPPVDKADAKSVVVEPVLDVTKHDSANQNVSNDAMVDDSDLYTDETDGGTDHAYVDTAKADDKSVLVDANPSVAGPAHVSTNSANQDDSCDTSNDASEGSSYDSDATEYASDIEPFADQINFAILHIRDQKTAKGVTPQVFPSEVFTYFDSKGTWNEGLKEALRVKTANISVRTAPKLPADLPASKVQPLPAKTEPSKPPVAIKDPDPDPGHRNIRSESSQPPVLSKRQRQRLRQRGNTPL